MSMFHDRYAGPVSLRVTTGNLMAEVFLVDHAFALVDRSVGELHAEVTPGVYKVKVRLGDVTAERLVVLDDDQSVDMSSDVLLASPAPIHGTSRTHERHADAARLASQEVALTAGDGASIMLMARRWSAPDAAAIRPARSRSGGAPVPLSLCRPDGSTIADLRDVSDRTGSVQDPARAVTIQVDPGAYVVHWYDEAAGVGIEQTVCAVAGWQTQVFLLQESEGRGNGQSVSMLMTKHGFEPDSEVSRNVEAARSALASERKVASELITESLFAKFDNPMLGLFGAHLMLIAAGAERETADEQARYRSKPGPAAPVHFHQDLFDTVVGNLARLLGVHHPDVVALSTRTTDRALTKLAPVTMPPLLWRSWLLLIEASQDHPPLVPVDTWRRASRPLPVRPFLCWAAADSVDDDFEAELAREVARALDDPQPRVPGRHYELSRDLVESGFRGVDERRRQLSRQLLLPRAAIDTFAAR